MIAWSALPESLDSPPKIHLIAVNLLVRTHSMQTQPITPEKHAIQHEILVSVQMLITVRAATIRMPQSLEQKVPEPVTQDGGM